ncbi:MAG: DNA topoisomerase I [Sulfolobales archaeon]
MIAEKPRAAAKIAEALGARSKLSIDGVPIWVGKLHGKDVVIAPAAGHLFTLYTNEKGYPVFNCSWGPRWVFEHGSKHLRRFYDALKKLSSGAEYYVNACDYDIEGSVIGYNIIKHFGDVSRAYRVKFSTLTKEEISRAFNDLRPLDWGNIESGLARHTLDWMWGINVSRALMSIYSKVFGSNVVLSAGRVQSPTLIELVRRYLERETFVPEPLFTVSVKIELNGKEYSLSNGFDSFKRLDDAKRVADLLRERKRLVVERAEKRIVSLEPPPPFNLTELQLEAARLYGYSPAKTLEIAENLYLESLISYPRTNSEKIPPTIDNTQILRKLSTLPKLGGFALELLQRRLLVPKEGPGEDPAHPAIYPTGYSPTRRLSKDESNIYELVVRRYLASFYPSAKVEEIIYTIVDPKSGMTFKLMGRRVISHEWLKVYHYRRINLAEAPVLRPGDEVSISSVKLLRLYTKPPPSYTKASILKWMESVGIGTEATRAEIIETLFKRKYVQGKSIKVTDLGLRVAHILSTLFKEITEVELTREFERKLLGIMSGKISRKEVIDEAIEKLSHKLEEVKKALESHEEAELKKKLGLTTGYRCSICGGDSTGEEDGIALCSLHLKAYQNLKKTYDAWRSGVDINFEDYVEAVSKLKSTGRFVKEVIKYLAKRVK